MRYYLHISKNEMNNNILMKDLFQNGQIPTPQTSKQREQVIRIVCKLQ